MRPTQLLSGGIHTSHVASCLSGHNCSPGPQRSQTFYGAGWSVSVHHHSPVVSIFGSLGLSSPTAHFSTSMFLLLLPYNIILPSLQSKVSVVSGNTLYRFKSRTTPLILVKLVQFVSSWSCPLFVEMALGIAVDRSIYVSSWMGKITF